MKPEPIHRVGATRPSGWRLWWAAARPRTLTIAVTPVLLPFLVPPLLVGLGALPPGGLAAYLALPQAIALSRSLGETDGIALNPILARTALTQFFFGLLLAIGISL